jgi:hypothetical protein
MEEAVVAWVISSQLALRDLYHGAVRRLLRLVELMQLLEPDTATDTIRRYARCASPDGSYSSLFFSEEPLDIARAKAICGPCLARTECLAAAIARAEPCGVWGGEIFVEGVPVAEKRRRGRPPRVPRPPLVVDEIPDVA